MSLEHTPTAPPTLVSYLLGPRVTWAKRGTGFSPLFFNCDPYCNEEIEMPAPQSGLVGVRNRPLMYS